MATSPDSVTYTQSIAEVVAPEVAPDWSNTNRPDAPPAGMFGIARETSLFEFYDGTTWRSPMWTSGGTFSGNVIFSGTVTTNSTLTANGAVTTASTLTANGAVTFNSSTTFNGANTIANAHSFGWATTTGARMTTIIDGGNGFVLSGTNATGAARTIASMVQQSSSSSWTWAVPQTLNAALSLAAVPLAITGVPMVQSGSSSTRGFYCSGTASGSLSATDGLFRFYVTADTAALSGAAFLNAVQITHELGGAALTGNRQALSATCTMGSTTGNKLAGNNPFYVAGTFTCNILATDGGTGTLLSNAWGQAYASNPTLVLYAGATNFRDAIAQETDIATLAQPARKMGVAIVQLATDVYQGAVCDTAIKIGGQGGGTAPGWRNGLQIGGDGTSMIPVNGTFISAYMNTNWSTVGSTATNGIDFQQYTFSSNFLRSKGFFVDGSGNNWVGRTLYAESSVDAKGSILSGTPSINSGGTGWTTDDIATDIYGGVYTITAAAGVVTAVAVFRSPVFQALTGQPATLTITGNTQCTLGAGPTAVINTSWSTSSTLAINASGGDVIVGTQAAIATNATSGFMMIPFCAGAPSGAPTNKAKGIAMVYDTTNHKFWCYDNGTNAWRGVVLT
jgi:hypothetical protein